MNEWLFLLETVGKSWQDLGQPGRVTAAVSGGADSVALLCALCELSRKEGFSLSAAHVDHGLRKTSGRDAEFVTRMCAELRVPCKVYRVQVKGKSEDAARRTRYEALRKACLENNTVILALAHHRRDQAETMLLHLFRGSGSGGLGAMAERSLRIFPESESILLWRPLLSVSPETIRAALTERGIPWAEDETNAADDYQRNYLRHHVLPAIAARFPQAEEAMGRAARILSEEDSYFRHEASLFLSSDDNACLHDPCRWVRYAPLQRLHPALRRYALRMACPVKLDWETTERLTALSPGGKINLPEGWRASCTQEYLHFIPPEGKEISPALPMPGTLIAQPGQGETGDGRRCQAVPKSVYDRCELRFWKQGDEIRPLGAPGTKSMQDYFVDKKVPQPFRRYIPLLCMGSRVVWAIGVGPGEEARTNPGDDALLLRYGGFLPGGPPEQSLATEEE
ncbi:MAG: tRNA lysidine(34) synthetase TilS [Clostridia bacterium]|nr:tRNA lysidine(34) synthetase TilS [Clostridia bacterium]